MVPEGVGPNGVFSCQGHTTEDDEDQNEIGEEMMVDEGVAGLPQSGKWGANWNQYLGTQT